MTMTADPREQTARHQMAFAELPQAIGTPDVKAIRDSLEAAGRTRRAT